MLEKKEVKELFNKIDKKYVEKLINENRLLAEQNQKLQTTLEESCRKKEEVEKKPDIWIDVKDKKLVITFRESVKNLTLNKESVLQMANIVSARLNELE